MSIYNFMLSCVEHGKSFITSGGLVLKPRMFTFRPMITEHFGFGAMHFMQRKIIL